MRTSIFICTCLIFVIPSQAEIITVDEDGPADFNSIQLAIDDADDGDTIIVQQGIYQELINFLGKDIVVTSTNPENPNIVRTTVIDAEFAFHEPSIDWPIAVTFRGNENSTCCLNGFRINGPIIGYDYLIFPGYSVHTHATISNCLLEGVPTSCGMIIGFCDGKISNCVIGMGISVYQCWWSEPPITGCHGTVSNCTILGRIWVLNDSMLTIVNSIIHSVKLGSGATLNIMYSNLTSGFESIGGGPNYIVNWGPGNIDTDPCFVREGSFDSNYTYFPGDYHLQSTSGAWDSNTNSWVAYANTSPCIDAGNPGCPLGSESSDANNVRINMGAYGGTATASKSPANWRSIADLTNDWAVDFKDLAVFVDYWLDNGECIPGDLDRNQNVDFSDYAVFTDNYLTGF